MSLDRFLSLLAASMGLIGAVFLAIGVLIISDKDMVRGTFNYSPTGWPSTEIISSMSIQKGHTQIGVAYILIAFLVQTACLIFLKEEISFTKSRLTGSLLAGGLIAISVIIANLADRGLCEYHNLNMKKIAARDYLKASVEERSTPLYSDVQAIASQYFNMTRKQEEKNSDFTKRFAEYVEYSLPKEANLLKFR